MYTLAGEIVATHISMSTKTIKAIGSKESKKIVARRMPRYIPGTKVKKMVK